VIPDGFEADYGRLAELAPAMSAFDPKRTCVATSSCLTGA